MKKEMKRIFFQDHNSINAHFKQSRDDFFVDEIMNFKTKDVGNYLIVKIQKQDMSTLELLELLEEELNCYNIGYAGLKDKYATTTQYLSFPLKFSRDLKHFRHPQIKILETFQARSGLSIGDLEGNRFKIRLHKVGRFHAQQITEILNSVMRNGMPNYFGYQRFGKDVENFDKAREIAHGEIVLKDRRINKLLSNAYQSHLFNDWLRERVLLSNEINEDEERKLALNNQAFLFRVLEGDVMLNSKSLKWENVTDIKALKKPYKEKKLLPTGLLCGTKVWHAQGEAGELERKYNDEDVQAKGDRRLAIVFPSKIESKHEDKNEILELSFTLPKGSYATVLIENLLNTDLTPRPK